LEAGKRVIFEKGFNSSRVSDITSLAGLAHGTFYLYFRSKDELLLDLLQRVREEMLSLIERGIYMIERGNISQGKDLLFLEPFRLMLKEKELAKIFFFEAICTSREFQNFYREGKELFIKKTEEALKKIGEPRPEVKSHILIGTARHLIESHILGGQEVESKWKEVLRELGFY
jgi:AcrR family transcriptional regulator